MPAIVQQTVSRTRFFRQLPLFSLFTLLVLSVLARGAAASTISALLGCVPPQAGVMYVSGDVNSTDELPAGG